MEFISRDEEKAVIVAVEGRVDATTAPEFEKYLTGSMGQGKKTLILNLNGLSYISSAGLRVVLIIAKKLKALGGELILVGLEGAVKQVFEISGFYTIFNVFETEQEALANCSKVCP